MDEPVQHVIIYVGEKKFEKHVTDSQLKDLLTVIRRQFHDIPIINVIQELHEASAQ